MHHDEPELITIEEIMELLHIGKNTAYQLLENGEIKAFRIGRKWKVEKNAVYEYIREKAGRQNQL